MSSYDYIIVGAGSAGCVLAARLSEDLGCRVLLLEAGGRDRSFAIHMPAGLGTLLSKPNPHNWFGWTEPQEELGNRPMYWPTGRGWGGTSSINGMAYIRGNRADYDGWAAQGLADWSYENVLPYFRKAEANSRGASSYHGAEGPLHVTDSPTWMPLSQKFLEACHEAGHPLTDDFNGVEQEGAGKLQMTVHRGRRWSTARGYLHPALKRPGLTVESHALARRLLSQGDKIVGVEWTRNGVLHRASADREVILCAGVTRTPQMLMLSGIGDAEALRNFDIPIIADRPEVGRNLQDHINLTLKWECPQAVTLYSETRFLKAVGSALRYLLFRKGLAQGIGTEAYAFARSGPDQVRPDLQMSFANALMEGRDLNEMAIRRDGFTINVWHLQPDARGNVTLRSANAADHPKVQPQYLTGESEKRALRQAVRLVRDVVRQSAFDGFCGQEVAPGASIAEDDAIDAYIRTNATGLFHPVGTARMGTDDDAVVDETLLVRGVRNLRIADASVMPRIVSGNTLAAVVMIAERAADFIRRMAKSPG